MMLWLDWKLFGNGYGMASPYFDDAFYWLSGRFYRWIGGLGAQLQSIEWFTPKPGTKRKLFGRDFVVFSSSRCWFRVQVSWALAERATGAETVRVLDVETVRSLKRELDDWGHGL